MVFVTVIMLVLSGASPASAKHADLAGKWYTDDPASLRSELERYFNSVGNIKPVSEAVGFIVPHAGTGASGPVAAYAYKAAALRSPGTVIVIGFTHRKSFPKAAVFNEKTFTTPLGELHTDRELSEKLIAHSKVFVDYPDAFDSENSIEMQLPFIQYSMPEARVVLIALGERTFENAAAVAGALYEELKNSEGYVIMGSTDMSHYLPYEGANRVDKATINEIKKLEPRSLYEYSSANGHEIL